MATPSSSGWPNYLNLLCQEGSSATAGWIISLSQSHAHENFVTDKACRTEGLFLRTVGRDRTIHVLELLPKPLHRPHQHRLPQQLRSMSWASRSSQKQHSKTLQNGTWYRGVRASVEQQGTNFFVAGISCKHQGCGALGASHIHLGRVTGP